MALRIMLAGLVASLGLELPEGPEVSAWVQSGRDWAHARLAERSGPVDAADRPDAWPAACRPSGAGAPEESPVIVEEEAGPEDAAFLAASEAMAAGFAADMRSTRDERPPVEDASAMLASEPTPAVGLPGVEEPAEVVGSDDGPDEATTEVETPATRADRVGSALRLTREAARAWSELIREFADEEGPAR